MLGASVTRDTVDLTALFKNALPARTFCWDMGTLRGGIARDVESAITLRGYASASLGTLEPGASHRLSSVKVVDLLYLRD